MVPRGFSPIRITLRVPRRQTRFFSLPPLLDIHKGLSRSFVRLSANLLKFATTNCCVDTPLSTRFSIQHVLYPLLRSAPPRLFELLVLENLPVTNRRQIAQNGLARFLSRRGAAKPSAHSLRSPQSPHTRTRRPLLLLHLHARPAALGGLLGLLVRLAARLHINSDSNYFLFITQVGRFTAHVPMPPLCSGTSSVRPCRNA